MKLRAYNNCTVGLSNDIELNLLKGVWKGGVQTYTWARKELPIVNGGKINKINKALHRFRYDTLFKVA